MDNPISTPTPPSRKPAKTKIMVTLRSFGESAATSTAEAGASGYAARRAQYGQRKSEANRQRDEVVEWLKAHKGGGSYRRVSDATVFGTFTLEATPDVVALLADAPNVESVTSVAEMPLELLAAPTP